MCRKLVWNIGFDSNILLTEQPLNSMLDVVAPEVIGCTYEVKHKAIAAQIRDDLNISSPWPARRIKYRQNK
jgi:hypothetical protein